MIWKCLAVVVLLSSWEVCRAQSLVNLVAPWAGKYGPLKPYLLRAPNAALKQWKAFDLDTSTYASFNNVNITLPMTFPERDRSIKATAYRITMPPHVKPKDYPSSWKLWVYLPAWPKDWITKVDGTQRGKFTNGVYEASINLPREPRYFRYWRGELELYLEFTDGKKYDIAEFEVLGRRNELNKFWVLGSYPCKQQLEMATRKKGPKEIYALHDSGKFSQAKLRPLFKVNNGDQFNLIHFTGTKTGEPIVIGAKDQLLKNVNQIVMNQPKLGNGNGQPDRCGTSFIRKIRLQGHLCPGDECSFNNDKGWKTLSWQEGGWERARRLVIEKPGKYRAYRLHIYPTKALNRAQCGFLQLDGLYFMGCPV